MTENERYATAPEPTASGPVSAVYLCWCDGTACSNTTKKPFTVCDECAEFGHTPMADMGLAPEDVEVD